MHHACLFYVTSLRAVRFEAPSNGLRKYDRRERHDGTIHSHVDIYNRAIELCHEDYIVCGFVYVSVFHLQTFTWNANDINVYWQFHATKVGCIFPVADRGVSGPWGPQFCGALCNATQRLPAGGAWSPHPRLGPGGVIFFHINVPGMGRSFSTV